MQTASRPLGTHAACHSASPHAVLPTAHRAVCHSDRTLDVTAPGAPVRSFTRQTRILSRQEGRGGAVLPPQTVQTGTPLTAWSPGHFPCWRPLALWRPRRAVPVDPRCTPCSLPHSAETELSGGEVRAAVQSPLGCGVLAPVPPVSLKAGCSCGRRVSRAVFKATVGMCLNCDSEQHPWGRAGGGEGREPR